VVVVVVRVVVVAVVVVRGAAAVCRVAITAQNQATSPETESPF